MPRKSSSNTIDHINEIYTDNLVNFKKFAIKHNNFTEWKNMIKNVDKGSTVKLSNFKESFWVKIVKIISPRIPGISQGQKIYIGKVSNDLVMSDTYTFGSYILFTEKNINTFYTN